MAAGRRRGDPPAMPIDFVAFTSDRRITGRIMLADDRLSDMLNAVARLVIRDARSTSSSTTASHAWPT